MHVWVIATAPLCCKQLTIPVPRLYPPEPQALVNKRAKMFEGGAAPVSTTTMDELGRMGAGVTLYFRMLVRCRE